jgi:oxygen-independent coproporphyrinogen III oxidase
MYRHVYVHVPFCVRRCSYCDFAIAVRSQVPVDDYLRALDGELAARFPTASPGTVDTVYFGGGTPSRLGGEGVARAIDLVRRHFPTADETEITIEANPEDVSVEGVRRWHEAGVNRVSLGVQSFDPEVLAWMRRTHDVPAVYRAAEALGEGGIRNWSLDLIFALPPEIMRDWERDVALALALEPPHLSVYGLTVEPGTPIARWRERGALSEANEERYEREFLLTDRRLTSAGYGHYEVSNYSKPGCESRHNSSYWRDVPYVGLGPSAHGFDGAVRRWNEREYAKWQARAATGDDPVGGEERLTQQQRTLESTYVGLRSFIGVEIGPRDDPLIVRWIDAGWGLVRENRLRLTPLGWLRLDALVSALTEHRSHY